MSRAAGWTLWELLCALTVAGVLASLGAPSFVDFVLDGRRTADVNAFVLAVQVARTEAAKRGRSIILCKTADRRRCGGAEIGYESGWMVFVNLDDRLPPVRAPDEPLLYVHVPEIEGTIRANRTYFEFRPRLRRSTNGTVVFCDRRGSAAARAVVISYTGRPRVDRVAPGGQALACANLP